MRILVCLKQVPVFDEVRMAEGYTLDRSSTPQMINPADESALEAAFLLRDYLGGSVTLLSMGQENAETMLRESLARGADNAFLLTDPAFAGADTLITAKCLKECTLRTGLYDLILCGRRALDGETGQVGPMMAAMLQIPCIPNVVRINIDGDSLVVHQLTEKGTNIWGAGFPALLTLCEWSYRLRLPTLRGLRKSRSQEVKRLSAQDIGLLPEECGIKASPTRVIRITKSITGTRACELINTKDMPGVLSHLGVVQC